METVIFRQELIHRLVQLNKRNWFLLSTDTSNVNWSNLKVDIQQSLDKLKKGAKVYEILACVLMSLIGVVALIKLISDNGGPDLNKGALLIFLTVANMFSAFSQRIRVESLEKQLLLLDMLERMNVEKQA